MAVEACEIARLPEELLSTVLSRASPRDACRAAAVSRAFRAAAGSEAVWSGHLPDDLPPLADGELSPAPASSKETFLRLSDCYSPVLLSDRLMSMWLDRDTGARCYMLSARALVIVWGDTPQYWRWIPITDSRFSEGAELMAVFWLEIRGKIDSKMLSQNSTYTAYIVFKMADRSFGLDYPVQEASVSVGETRSTCRVCLGYDKNKGASWRHGKRRRYDHAVPRRESVDIPRKRADGWWELDLGDFFNEGGEDGEVSISLTETKGGNGKRGLIVQGIEIRVKKSR